MKFITQFGLNHNGNINLTCELIIITKKGGANIIKLQLAWRDKSSEDNKKIKSS